MKTIYLLLFVITFSWCAPGECTSDEAKSIGCKVTKPYIENGTKVQYLCFVDAEEYVDGSSKNIPHCITTYPRTWTVDTKPFPLFSSLAQDHFHIYVYNGGFKSLKTAVDDHSSAGLKQRVINGNLNTRVNGDMAIIGATVMIQRDGEYNFDPSPTNNKSSVYSEKIFKNDGGFSASNFTQCRSDFVYNPNKLSYCQNSASSTFDFSEKNDHVQKYLTGKNVVYARLYWGGSIYQNWKFKNEVAADFISNALNFIKGYSRIDFKVPGKEQAITIDAKPEDIFWTGSFSEYRPKSMTLEAYDGKPNEHHKTAVKAGINYVYVASADVTKIVQDSLGATKEERTFYAGNIRATTTPIKYELLEDSDRYFQRSNGEQVDLGGVWGSLLFSPVNGHKYGGYWMQTNPAQYAGWSLVIIYNFDDEIAREENIEPKMVSIFDGLEKLAPEWLTNYELEHGASKPKTSIVETKFNNLNNPKHGDINATLTMLSFGAKREVVGDDIEIKHKGVFKSVTSKYNEKGNQFNSTMTKFGKFINPGKNFTNQVDLDIFDISNFIENKDPSVQMRFTVASTLLNKGGIKIVNADRPNLALVGFSSRMYRPEVCYVEDLYYKEPGKSGFVKADKIKIIDKGVLKKEIIEAKGIKKETILKFIVKIMNSSTNEDAENFVLKTIINPNQKYEPNSTTIVQTTTSSNYSDGMPGQKHDADNFGLQRLSGNNLTFFLGQGAMSNRGGTIKKNEGNYAYVIYKTKLENNFKENSYKTTITSTNPAINLDPYDTYIKKCQPYDFNITLEKQDEPNDFVPSSKPDDGTGAFKNRLLTQIVSKPFDIYITNYGEDGKKRAPHSPVDVKVELVTSCNATSNLYEKNINFSEDMITNKKSEILLKGIKVDRAYSTLKFRISHPNPKKKTDPTAPDKITACENLDDFAVRPSHFRLWDNEAGTIISTSTKSFTGGETYNDAISLAAMKPNDSDLTRGYANSLLASLVAKNGNVCNAILDSKNRLNVNFTEASGGLGKITRSANSNDGFSYSDIGDTTFYVVDSSYTSVDQHISPRGDDCVKKYKKPVFDPNNPADDPDGIGRVSCDIELKKEGNVTFQFIPEDMQISNLKIIKDDAVTYLDNDGMQRVKLCFDVTAKLSDTLKNLHPELYGDYRYLDEKYLPAKFYVDACYANEANFELKLHKVPLNFTDNNGNAGTLEKANEEILFFEVLGSNTKKLTDPNAKKGMFFIKKSAFEEGKASAEVFFNFARKVNHAKNPFTVSSDDFSLDNLDTIINSKSYKYESPAKKTSANFYYGRVYAPYYEGPADGFFAKIYYGIYCDDCDKATYLTSGTGIWQAFPAATSWYVNPSHKAGVLKFDDFSFSNNTVLGNNVSAVNNGEQLIFVSNQKPVKDIAKMHANMWLIYNEFNKDATTNDFTLKFLVPDGNWAGKTLKEGSEKGDVGNVVGAEGNFKDLSKKTNRRISW
ncbi:hypothetical protein YZ70_07695 [Campylobacter concisus]|uniref:hypothetical protein n=1 Tax=Campylobacter concisus TaxID=199 RepID=UPI0018805E89|nr:hypothetical protein [Campylobacter concisus]MBE8585350.1 hypothetical protein [Campylobacter concisus]